MRLKHKITTLLFSISVAGSLFADDNIEFKGVSFSASNKATTNSDLEPIAEMNANWISVVPYGFLSDHEVKYDSKFQWIGERTEGIRKCIKLAQKRGLKTMLKPHVWIGHGEYTGTYQCNMEEDWIKLEESYRGYIMTFVEIAKEEKVEMFCIGTEWGKFVKLRPDFWKDLIVEIRANYDGKLVYAANWDDYQKVPFWDQLDYIGIDAYFPLSLAPYPKMSELIKSWKLIMPIIEEFSASQKKKIVFTEFGFKSTSHATISPWEHKDEGKYSEKVQDFAFKSFFQTIWKKSWFKGGFIWKWYHNHAEVGGKGDKDFTPQNKLAEETIRKFYGM